MPCSTVNNLPQALANPQVIHREMVQTIEHPVAGSLKLLRNPIRFSETPIEVYTPPPTAGEHTDAVLGELGYDANALKELRERGVI